MDRAKYIIFETPELLETPIVFPVWLSHGGVARALTGGNLDKVLSAGFVTITPGLESGDHQFQDFSVTVDCYGRSDSLNIESKEGDSRLVARSLRIE